MINFGGQRQRIGIVLSGYEQALTLASGAMLGFDEKGIEFDVISTSGPGALVGLLALAPRKSRKQALEELPNIYTSDLLYKVLPFNVRMSVKNSPFAKPMYKLGKLLPRFSVAPNDPAIMQRLFNSWVDFAVNAITPGFELTTPGLLSVSPLLEEMISFEKLRNAATRFYMSTFDQNNKKVEIFDNQTTTLEAFVASQSSSLFHPPQRVFTSDESDGGLFYSSINHDATGLQAIWCNADKEPKLDMVLALDPITDAVWREPTNIADSFKLMLANPVAALQALTLSLYAQVDRALGAKAGRRLPPLYRIPVPIEDYPKAEILKWTHSNALALQQIGRRAATEFADVLRSGDERELQQRRFFNLRETDRGWDIMHLNRRLFDELKSGETQAFATTRVSAVSRASATSRTSAASSTSVSGVSATSDGDHHVSLPHNDPSWWRENSGLALLVGGGAPNLQLSAGALCAFYEDEISFDVMGTSGAGALPALLYAAPAEPGSQVRALQETVNLHIADEIEHVMPYNYKVFFKPGPFATPAWQFGQRLPRFQMRAEERYSNDLKRLYNDTLDLMISIITPSTLSFCSKAMCSRVPMLDKSIAWEQLKDYPKQFYLNTFNLKTQRMNAFSKSNLTPETFWAALAMPWLYEPTRVGDKVYTEGASHDPTGLGSVLRHWNRTQREERRGAMDHQQRQSWGPDIDYQTGEDVLSLIRSGTLSDRDNFNPADISKIIVLETISSNLWTNPETIHEAIELTIMEPIVTLSEVALATYGLFEWVVNKERSEDCVLPPLYGVPFEVPDWEISDILRWSYSSALTLWNTGHSAGKRFMTDYRNNDIKAYRYYPNVTKNRRVKEMLRLFADLLAHRPEAKDLL